MFYQREKLDDGMEVEIHRFDTKEAAVEFLTVTCLFVLERHETWGFSSGIDFYRGERSNEHASLREKSDNGHFPRMSYYSVAFWLNPTVVYCNGDGHE